MCLWIGGGKVHISRSKINGCYAPLTERISAITGHNRWPLCSLEGAEGGKEHISRPKIDGWYVPVRRRSRARNFPLNYMRGAAAQGTWANKNTTVMHPKMGGGRKGHISSTLYLLNYCICLGTSECARVSLQITRCRTELSSVLVEQIWIDWVISALNIRINELHDCPYLTHFCIFRQIENKWSLKKKQKGHFLK